MGVRPSAANLKTIAQGALLVLAVFAFYGAWADGIWSFLEVAPQGLLPDNRTIVDGRYYMWSKNHGGYIEVSQHTWEWLPVHQTRAFLEVPVGLAAGAFLVMRYRQRFGRGDVRPGWTVFASEDETTSIETMLWPQFAGGWSIVAGISIVLGLAFGGEWVVSADRSPWAAGLAGAFFVFGAVLVIAMLARTVRRG